ncbi:MAG: hypothetical protein WCX73_05530 [Candidatus Pacearchaeota archaeon]
MKSQKTSFWKSLATSAILGISALASNLHAEQAKPIENSEPKYSVRLRLENNSGEQLNVFRSTLGVAPFNEKGYNKGQEFLRIYNFTGRQNKKSVEYTNWGFSLPQFKIGDLENTVTLFGLTGDRNGFGVQTKHTLGKWDLFLNTEKETLKDGDSKRIGLGLDYNAGGDINPGIGFDRVETAKGITNYMFGKVVVNVTNTDQIGAGLSLASGFDKTNTLATYYMHHGPNEKWGTRTRTCYDWNNETDSSGLSFESIIVERPTFSRNASGPAVVGRSQGDLMSKQIVDAANLAIERVPLADRSKGGIISRVAGNFRDKAGIKSGYLEGDLGYSFKENDGIKPSAYGFYRTDFSDVKANEKKIIGASALFYIGKNWCIETTYNHPVSGNVKPSAYLGVQYIKTF